MARVNNVCSLPANLLSAEFGAFLPVLGRIITDWMRTKPPQIENFFVVGSHPT